MVANGEQSSESKVASGPAWAGRLIELLAKLLLVGFFRQIERVGVEQVPHNGPLVFVGNHRNGLVDPALLLGFLPRQPRFLAKSTLWKNPVVRPFLELASAIPVYRRQDKGVDTSKNSETFASCHQALAEGGSIGLFPEGRSHNEPSLIELKTGVSRIVLEAEERFGPLGVQIVPVGLNFDDKGRFRSRVLVRVGQPLEISDDLEHYAREPREAVRRLTEKVRQALAEVTLNYQSWEEGRLLERAAELYSLSALEVPRAAPLEDRFELDRAFLTGYRQLSESHPERLAQVTEAVRRYDERLDTYRLHDSQVASTYPPRRVLRFLAASLFTLLIFLPLAALGTVVNAIPFIAIRWAARHFGQTEDQLATYKVLGSLLFYPLVWGAVSAGAYLRAGLWTALLVAVAMPLAAWAALRFHERRSLLLRQARAYLLLRSGQRWVAELRDLRQQVVEEVRSLAEIYLARKQEKAQTASADD